MALECGQSVLADDARCQAGRIGNPAQQIRRKFGNVLASLAERRDPQRDDVETMIKFLAKLPQRTLLRQVARGRREDAHVDLDARLACITQVGLLVKHTRQPTLQRHRQIGDFFQQQSPAMSQFEGARDTQGVALGLAFRAEQFDFQTLGRQGRAIHDDERTFGPLGPLVDQAGHGLLAAARRTRHQDAAAGRRDLVERAAHTRRIARRADERDFAPGAAAETGVLALQLVGFDRAVDDQQQAVGLERLLDEIVGAVLDRRNGGVDGAVAADHDHRNRRVLVADYFQELEPVELAALKPDVEDDERRAALSHRVDRLGAVVRATSGMALILEDAGNQRADVAFVVDDEDVVTHDLQSSAMVRGSLCGGRVTGRRRDFLRVAPEYQTDARTATLAVA